MDPLAVMMSNAVTQPINFNLLEELYNWLTYKARNLNSDNIKLSWIDGDEETQKFINYWFDLKQRRILRRLAYILHTSEKIKAHPVESNILKIAFSKLIITKKVGASLAWDVSHSRPHKVADKNSFDIWEGYARSYAQLKKILAEQYIVGKSKVRRGDARKMTTVRKDSIDAVITSPPYLNAIDYLRGHKMSLVWLGYTLYLFHSFVNFSAGARICLFDVW